jgi:Domain of unknown function (DUF4394)
MMDRTSAKDAGSDAGFDIHYSPDGTTADGRGLAALQVNGAYRMYRVELLNGRARLVGAFPASRQVTDLTAGFNRDELEGVLLGGRSKRQVWCQGSGTEAMVRDGPLRASG